MVPVIQISFFIFVLCLIVKGIEPALEMMWPEASRRFCCRHLNANFKKDYPGIMMHKLFWKVVNATSEFSFKKALESVVQHGGQGCARWFLDLGPKEHWSKHMFDPKVACDQNTSNFVESFNSTLGVHRCNPIFSLLEGNLLILSNFVESFNFVDCVYSLMMYVCGLLCLWFIRC